MTRFVIQFNDVAESSKASYMKRLKSILSICNVDDARVIAKHPKTYHPLLVAHSNGNDHTLHSYIVTVTKLLSSNPEYARKHPNAYTIWRRYLAESEQRKKDLYNNNTGSDEQIENVITMEELIKKRDSMTSNPHETHRLFSIHRKYLLLWIFTTTYPKRADLGNVKIIAKDKLSNYTKKQLADLNFIVMDTNKSYLHLHKFKTGKFFEDGIQEELAPDFIKVLYDSLKRFPREYLLTDLEYKPMTNNSYSQFVRRTFENLFNRPMNINLWRHVYVTSQIDFNKITEKDKASITQKMGTSGNMAQGVYRWINLPEKVFTENDKNYYCYEKKDN
jgi:hypothetical protein